MPTLQHAAYTEAKTHLSPFQRDVVRRMETQRGADWWYQFARESSLRAYVIALDPEGRVMAMRTILRDATSDAIETYKALIDIA